MHDGCMGDNSSVVHGIVHGAVLVRGHGAVHGAVQGVVHGAVRGAVPGAVHVTVLQLGQAMHGRLPVACSQHVLGQHVCMK